MTLRHTTRTSVLILVLVLVGFVLIGAATVSAQSTNGTGVDVGVEQESDEPETETGERIDNSTVVLDSSYSSRTGRATLTIRSERLQTVTLSDAGGFLSGGEIAQNSVILKAGSTQDITVDATKVDGYVGVSVATPTTLYAVPIETRSTLFDPPTESDFLALVIGVLLVLVSAWGLKRRKDRVEDEGVVRVDG